MEAMDIIKILLENGKSEHSSNFYFPLFYWFALFAYLALDFVVEVMPQFLFDFNASFSLIVIMEFFW